MLTNRGKRTALPARKPWFIERWYNTTNYYVTFYLSETTLLLLYFFFLYIVVQFLALVIFATLPRWGGSLTQRPKRSICCFLVEIIWLYQIWLWPGIRTRVLSQHG